MWTRVSFNNSNFFSGYAHMVSVDNEDSNEGKEAEAFQKLIFLVRDFDFPDYEYGYHDLKGTDPSSPNNFCRDTFIRDEDKCAKENLFVREKILQSYKDVAAFLLPYPGLKFVRSQELSRVQPDEEFSSYMKRFVEKVNSPSHLVTKKIGGQEMTGQDFQKYIEAWAKLCEKADQHFPKVQTIAETTAIIQNTLAFSTANSWFEKELYKHMEDQKDGVEDREFQKLFARLQEEAIKLFDGMKKLGSETVEEKYRELLKESIEKLLQSNRKVNQMKLDRAATERQIKLQQENLEKLHHDMSRIVSTNERERKVMEVAIEHAQEELRNVSQKHEEDKAALAAQVKLAEENAMKIAKGNEEAKKEMAAQIKLAQEKLDSVTKKNEAMQQSLREEVERMRAEALRTEKERQEAEKRYQKEKMETETKLAAHEQRMRDMEEQHQRDLRNNEGGDENPGVGDILGGLGQLIGEGLKAFLVLRSGGLLK